MALEVDVWHILKKYILDEISELDIVNVKFHYDLNLNREKSDIVLTVFDNKQTYIEHVELERDRTEKLIEELCNKFNIPFVNMCKLMFELKPGNVPIFNVGLYPFVGEERELNTSKSRMNVSTVN